MKMSRKRFLRTCGGAALGLWSALGVAQTADGADWPVFRDEEPEAFWRAVRARYLIEPGFAYLNTGGLGPAAAPVQAAADEVRAELARRVETGHARFDEARAVLARFLGCGPDELAFVRNATEGNGIIAAGLPLAPGDEVVFETHAHPGGSFPWLLQQQRRDLVVKLFEPAATSRAENVRRLEAQLTPRTRVVQVSHVTAPTGLVLPVREIAMRCRARGIWLHVDGAQAAGMFPFAVAELGCDSYATSGHKWLGAPHETGLLYVRRERLHEVVPAIAGAYSGDVDRLPGRLELNATAGRFEYGTRDAAAAAGLAAAAVWQERIGRERLFARARTLVERLRAGLARVPGVDVLTPADVELSAAMLTFRSSRVGHEVLFRRLVAEHRIRCRPVSEQGLDALRVSCHGFNLPEEIDRLTAAVAAIVRTA